MAQKPFKINKPMSLKNDLETYQEQDTYTTVYIPLDSFIINDNNEDFRSITSDDQVEAYALNFELFGMAMPLEAMPSVQEGKYKLIGGETRYRALQLLKSRGVDLFPHGVPTKLDSASTSDIDSEIKRYNTNLMQRHLTPPQLAKFFGRYIELLKEKEKAGGPKIRTQKLDALISQMTNMSERAIRRYRTLYSKLTPGLFDEWVDGTITEREADEYAKLSEVQQEIVLRNLKAGKKIGVSEAKYIDDELHKKYLSNKKTEIDATLSVDVNKSLELPEDVSTPPENAATSSFKVNAPNVTNDEYTETTQADKEEREQAKLSLLAELENRNKHEEFIVSDNDPGLKKKRYEEELKRGLRALSKAWESFVRKEAEYIKEYGENSPEYKDFKKQFEKDTLFGGEVR